MENARTFIYSSDETPKLLRPAKPDEIHIWYRPDGKTLRLVDGVWTEVKEPGLDVS